MGKKVVSILLSLAMIITMVSGLGTVNVKAASATMLTGVAHVQTYGNKAGAVTTIDGMPALVLGTRGQSKRVEAVTINFNNTTGYSGSMVYQVHVQSYGWQNWMAQGQPAGTSGKAKRLEGIRIKLTGELAEHYSVRYKAHIQTYGDNQGWVYDGALAGTTGESKRLEEIVVQLVPKNSSTQTPVVNYRVHRQTYGWEPIWAKNGQVSGTVGQSKRLEGITVTVNNSPYSGNIVYQTHVQSNGWMSEVSNGEMSGTQGQGKRLEAIKIRLTGEIANHYDVYYRVHAQSYGWLNWVSNGEAAGTSGLSKRLEAIQIVLTKKGEKPADNYAGVTSAQSSGYINNSNNNNSKSEATNVWYEPVYETVLKAVPRYQDIYKYKYVVYGYECYDCFKKYATEYEASKDRGHSPTCSYFDIHQDDGYEKTNEYRTAEVGTDYVLEKELIRVGHWGKPGEKVWHDAVYETKTKEIPVYGDVEGTRTVYCEICNNCGTRLYTQEDCSNHLGTRDSDGTVCGSYRSYQYLEGTGEYKMERWTSEIVEEPVLVKVGYWE